MESLLLFMFFFFFFFLQLLLFGHISFASQLPFMVPIGNSLAFSANTLDDASQTYRCCNGHWILLSKNATLAHSMNNSLVIGSYYTNNVSTNYAGTWSLRNNVGEFAESGQPASLVDGGLISAVQDGNFLARAVAHLYPGRAARISYIAQFNTTGATVNATCMSENSTISLSFRSTFIFWTQDMVPPSVPDSLAVPAGRPVEGFFGQGVVSYVLEGRNWAEESVSASLYDIPGGMLVGSYKTTTLFANSSQVDLYCLTINDPNGFTVCGKQVTAPVLVTPDALPWSLMAITNSTGNTEILGPFKFMHMVSTWAGLPPSVYSPSTTYWSSPFTAIFWIYTN